MSYDPREGENPYLGMDAEDTTASQDRVADTPVMPSRMRQASRPAPGDTQLLQPGAQGTASRDADATVLRPRAEADAGAGVPRPRPGDTRRQPLQRRKPRRSPRQPHVRGAARPLRPARSTGASLTLASLALSVLALAARLCAVALAVAVVASAVLPDVRRDAVLGTLGFVLALVPRALAGRFVVETPFGGAFRGDLALMSTLLFVADWCCLLYAHTLRTRRERGV